MGDVGIHTSCSSESRTQQLVTIRQIYLTLGTVDQTNATQMLQEHSTHLRFAEMLMGNGNVMNVSPNFK